MLAPLPHVVVAEIAVCVGGPDLAAAAAVSRDWAGAITGEWPRRCRWPTQLTLDDAWRRIAIARWGHRVPPPAPAAAYGDAAAQAALGDVVTSDDEAYLFGLKSATREALQPHLDGSDPLPAFAERTFAAAQAARRPAAAAVASLAPSSLPHVAHIGVRIFGVAAWQPHGAASGGGDSGSGSGSGSGSAVTSYGSPFYAYYRHRAVLTRPPASPLHLIQEEYCDDLWRTIACCVLCSRTSGSEKVHATIASFMHAFPTPSAVMDADEAALADLLHPLGLNRERTITRTAAGFLSRHWTGGTVSDLVGCGPFVADSAAIFCREGGFACRPADQTLQRYVAWLRRAYTRAQVGAMVRGGARWPTWLAKYGGGGASGEDDNGAAAGGGADEGADPVEEDDSAEPPPAVAGRKRGRTSSKVAARKGGDGVAGGVVGADDDEEDDEGDASGRRPRRSAAKRARRAMKQGSSDEA